MKKHLLFEPEKLKKYQFPFSFYHKIQNGKTIEIVHEKFSNKIISKEVSKELVPKLAVFSEEEYVKFTKKILSNYAKANFNLSEEEFLIQNSKNFFFDAFRNIKASLSEIKTFHRFQTSTNSYSTLACTFNTSVIPILSFSAKKENNFIDLTIFATIEDETFAIMSADLCAFLLSFKNTYYFLSRQDWILMEDLLKFEKFTVEEFTNKITNRLKSYVCEFESVFEKEERFCSPKQHLHVSELGGNTLLLLPSWEYDGHVVEGEKDAFEKHEGSKLVVYKRDKIAEKETLDFLKNSHPSFENKSSFYLTFEEASHKNWFYNFFHKELKIKFEVSGMDMLSFFRYSPFAINTQFDILKTIDNEIVAKFVVTFGNEKIDLKFLQKTLTTGNNFIVLKDNTLGIITDEWMDEFGVLIRYSTVNQDEITFATWVLVSAQNILESKKELQLVVTKDWLKDWKKWNKSDETLFEKPNNIQADLRSYQHKGFEWMHLMSQINAGTLLADDMGLGKTLQTITAISNWLEMNPKGKFLIICPSSLIYNWKKEIEKFCPKLSTFVYHGTERRFEQYLSADEPIMISSYSIVRNDIDELVKIVWEGIVLDESHNIKNYDTLQTQAVLRLIGKKRILLNGTPIMNNVSDLFPQLSFILPQLFSSPAKFKKEFESSGDESLLQVQLEALRKVTSPFILRRTKENVAPDLPPKTESILWCEMQDDQRLAYETIKSQIKENVLIDIKENGVNKAKFGVLQGITKLRQVCSSPQLIKEENEFRTFSSIKINQLVDLLNSNLKNNKVIVFSQFLGTMDLISETFVKNNIRFLQFSGSTKAEKRMELVNQFQDENSDIQVFLLSLMAGNSGINLTQANYVFLVEPWWNKAVQQQAIDRTHRIGQSQHVFAYNMICKDSIEEKIIQLQERKQFISDEVISSDENFVKNLSEEDITFLFE